MKVAVTYDDGDVFQHFGHTETFKIYEVEGDKIVSSEVIGTEGEGHSSLAGFLKNKGVDILICGGMGGGAKMALAAQGIEFYPGVSGNADMAVEAFLRKELQYNAETECHHHDHGEEGHQCGGHHHEHEHHQCGGHHQGHEHHHHEGGCCGRHHHEK
ncbi:MAG TPA: NifB/NifX family molybdenum-iron cluster-binding protein [Fusobacterium sp.]|uniref:NifB/NifX family molybdenum-iron cluster-binding protein n=1 Tax=Fusobacterium sp. TaxID=68766 RepID=UPI002F402FE0